MGDQVLGRLQEPPSPARDHELRRMLSDQEHLVTKVDPRATYWVTGIGAPVFGPSGVVELSMTVSPVGRSLSGREVTAIGDQVRLAAEAVAEELGGHEPVVRPTGRT
jgi:DNA-binding IclR family transcriptional regulator